jgi:hypothetical protein
MIIKTYKKALQSVKKHDPVPITLVIGEKRFEGVAFPAENAEPIWEGYDTWLLIQASGEDLKMLSHTDGPDENGHYRGLFHGRSFDLFGETYGDDFVFMGKCRKHKSINEVEWPREEWEEYVNHSVECQLIF